MIQRTLFILCITQSLSIQTRCIVGSCGKHPRLGRMPDHRENTKFINLLVRLQLFQGNDQGVLQQVTETCQVGLINVSILK